MQVGYERFPIADLGDFVLSSGRPIVLYGINFIPAVTGTKPDIQIYNDATGTSAIVVQENPTADVPTTIIYPQGIVFGSGCFIDVADANDLVQLTVFYKAL